MSLSNRVSLDTDVLFVRNMFVFSTNTNNIPVSANYMMAIGPNGQMMASNTLYNLSTYGVGYLPSTLSSLEGEIVSIGNLVLAGGVIPAQLFSVQTALQSSISSTQGSVDTLSSYILLNVIPSTVSTFNAQVSSLNSSFQGYVAGTSVTPVQLASTYTAATTYTDQQISTLSTTTYNQICTLSNYFDVSSATVTQFSTLAGNVSAQSNYFSLQIYLLGSNFNALSASTRLLNESNSTLVGELVNEVEILSTNFSSYLSSLEAEIEFLSSITINPGSILGLLSTSAYNNYPFFSNIKVSSIDVRAAGTAAAPALAFTSAGDTDTGIYHPGDGIIAMTTNSSERLRLSGFGLSGSTSLTFYGPSSGQVALNPDYQPNLTLTSGCNDNNNAVCVQMFMPSTAFKTFVGGGTGFGGITYRQLQTFAYDLTSGGIGTVNLATSIHSTGNVAIKSAANESNALYVNGSTFINGQLGVSAAGSAAAPALYFAESGNDTGFFKPGDGAIGITTNSGERFRFSGTQFIGCNSDIILYGSNGGGINSYANSNDPNILLYTSRTNSSTAFVMSNPDVYFQTYLTGRTATGFAENNQLITYAYPGANPAIAIHSTGTVAIGGAADPTFALTVTGGIRQTAPYIWSYGPVSASTPYNLWIFPPVDFPGPLTPNPLSGYQYTTPYTGAYIIDLSYYYLIANTTVGLPITVSNITAGTPILNTDQSMTISGSLLGQSYAKRVVNLNSNDVLGVWAFVSGGNAFSRLYWTIQYLG